MGRKEMNMTGEHDCADKNTKDQEEKDISSSKVSKKRKLVQTNLFAFMGQGQSTKKAKLDHPQESTLDNVTEKDKIDETILDCMDPNQGCTSNNVTDSELQSGKSVPELDSNSSVEEKETMCLSANDPTSSHSGTKEQEVSKGHIDKNLEKEEFQPSDSEQARNPCDFKTKKKRDFSKHKSKKHKTSTESGMVKEEKIGTEIETDIQGGKDKGIDNSESESINQEKRIGAEIPEHSEIHSEGKGDVKAKTRSKTVVPPEEVDEETDIDNDEKEKTHEENIIGTGTGETSEIHSELDCDVDTSKKEVDNDESIKETTEEIETTTGDTSIELSEGLSDELRNNAILLEFSDLPQGWLRLKVPRQEIGKFDKYVQSPD